MRSLFNQVGIARQGSAPPPGEEALPLPRPDLDVSEAMVCFATPKRFGHHGPISDVSALSYESTNGLVAVVSRGGMIKVSGAPGVELVLEEEGSFAAEDPPAHLLFPTPRLLVGVTATGGVLAWDLVEGRRCGHLSSLLDSGRFIDGVTSVHSPDRSPGGGAPEAPVGAGAAASDAGEERYIFIGLESGRVRVVQVLPVLRASGYVVEPRNMSSGAPEELLGSNGSGGVLGAVTSITSFRDKDGGGLALFGFRHGGIVLWDWVRRKRLAIRGLTRGGERREGEEDEEGEDGSGEVTSLAFHPTGEVFAAGFSSGCYAVFPASSSSDLGPPRWVSEVGDDGLCPREGPTIVRTAVSLVRWVSVRGGAARAWGLLVAGGVEIDEGEEPDGVNLLVPPCAPEGGAALTPSGGGRAKKKDLVAAALAPLETAVFVPFAIGQERLSSVHCASSRSADGGFEGLRSSSPGRGSRAAGKPPSSAWFKDVAEGGEGDSGDKGEAAEEDADASEELVVLGLVTWNEEVRGDDGRLQFRRASSVQACPIQTSPYVALLQLAPEKVGPHLSGFAPVTAVASTPLLSSATILDFMTCVAGRGGAGSPSSSPLLRGGGLKWPDSVAAHARDEALCTSEMLVVGHSNGCLSFWECCGPASRQSGVSISEGRVAMREVPSGASLLGSLPAAELAGAEGEDAVVTALDVWIERDHVAAAERNACWVAVGFGNGNVIVLVLSSRMEVDVNADVTGAEVDSGGGTPLAEKPVTVSNVLLGDETAEDDSAGGGGGGGGWKRLIGRAGRQASSADKDEAEDDEISAAIAAAQAEARRIETLEDSGDDRENDTAIASPRASDDGIQQARVREGAEEGDQGTGDQGTGGQGTEHLRQELSEAMAEEGAWGDSSGPPVASKPCTDSLKEDRGKQQRQQSSPRKASLVQLALHLHGHPVRCVTLSYDAPASSLALVVADAEGVVSVTDVSTGSASLLPIRVPQSRPCYPSLAIGPLPSALCKPQGKQEREYGAAGALFVFMEGWLNVFDLSSRDPIDVVQVPGLATDGGSGGGDDGHNSASARSGGRAQHEESAEAWLSCIDECGVPLTPYASEPLSSFTPLDAGSRQDSELGEGSSGRHNREGSRSRAARAQTAWVSPSASRTALESHNDHELQVLSGAPPPRPLLLVVRGEVAAVFAITDKDSANENPLSRRRPASPTVAPFRGRSGAALVVKSRMTVPPAEGRGPPPVVDRAGVCMLAAGKAARRGCLVFTDTSGFVTGMLLPSLFPIFRDRLPVSMKGSGLSGGGGAMALAQKSVCNLVGELTIRGAAGELTRWSVLTDEACDALMESKPRLVKVSALVRPTAGTQPLLANSQSSGGTVGSSGGEASTPPKSRAPRGMLRRISLGGSKKSLAEVFAVDPSPQPAARRQSTAVDPSPQPVSRRQSTSGSLNSVSSTSSASGRRGSGRDAGRGNAQGQQQHQRDALFGDREAGGGDGGGGGATAAGRAGGGVSGAHAAVSEARDLAIERGEKLENMVDKSRQLEDSAMAFGDMAKELRKQQEDEACCVS